MATVDELLQYLHRPIEVDLPEYGTVQLRPLLDDQLKPLQGIVEAGLSARELAVSVVHWLLVTPSLERDEVSRWPDEQLQTLIEAWSRDERGLGHPLPKRGSPFEGFARLLAEQAYKDPASDLRAELSRFKDNLADTIHMPDLGLDGLASVQQIRSLALDAITPTLDLPLAAFKSPIHVVPAKDILAEAYQNIVGDAASMKAVLGTAADFNFHFDALQGINAVQEAKASVLSVLGDPPPTVFDALGPFQDAVARSQELYDSVAAPMFGVDSLAHALDAAASWFPDVQTLSPLHDMTEHLAALEKSWLTSDLESIRVGAGIIGQVTALAEQDWLLNWPSPEILEHWKELDEAKETLDKHGYGFTIDLWRWAFLRTLVRPVNPRMQGGVITRRLTKATQEAEFREYMAALVRGLEKLPYKCRVQLKPRSRWKAIDQALDAHARRHYMASVPILLAQVDGMLTCLLLARGELWPPQGAWDRRIYMGLDQRTGKEIAATSLRKRLGCTQLHQDPVLRELKALLGTKLDERNDIIHGADTAYGTPKLSTQLVLVLAVLASELGNIAEGYTKH
jgi:hypothetical protein